MAFTFSLNNLYTSQQECLYRFFEKLTLNGWTVMSSGDGTGGSFSGVGNVITGFSTTTDAIVGAITNRRAWARLRSPDGVRELLIQHGAFNTATDLISLIYSPLAGFVGTGDGVIGAQVAPTATDGCIVMGEQRPSLAMTGVAFCAGTTGSFRMDFAHGGAAEEYAFYALARASAGTGAYLGGVMYDRLLSPVAGDPDSTVIYAVGEAGAANAFTVNSSFLCDGRSAWLWGLAGVGAEPDLSVRFPAGTPIGAAPQASAMHRQHILLPVAAGVANFANQMNPMGLNPYDNEVDLIEPVYWGSHTLTPSVGIGTLGSPAPFGHVKGESRLIKAVSSASGFSNLDTNTGLTRLGQAGGFWLIWDGATTPIV